MRYFVVITITPLSDDVPEIVCLMKEFELFYVDEWRDGSFDPCKCL